MIGSALLAMAAFATAQDQYKPLLRINPVYQQDVVLVKVTIVNTSRNVVDVPPLREADLYWHLDSANGVALAEDGVRALTMNVKATELVALPPDHELSRTIRLRLSKAPKKGPVKLSLEIASWITYPDDRQVLFEVKSQPSMLMRATH